MRFVRISFVAVVLAVTTLAGASAFAGGWTRGDEVPAVMFKGSGTGGLKLEGKTNQLNVTDDGKTLGVVVTLTALETGISLRDKHMREKYLEVGKFPEAKLEIAKDKLGATDAGKPVSVETKGNLTLHGVTKEAAFKYSGSCDAAGLCTVDGDLALDMHDYGINVPTYLGITVKPDVSVHVHFVVKKP